MTKLRQTCESKDKVQGVHKYIDRSQSLIGSRFLIIGNSTEQYINGIFRKHFCIDISIMLTCILYK